MQPLACVDVVGPEQERANKIRAGFRSLLAQRGVDADYARRLPRLLRREGLTDVLTNDRHFEQEGFRALFRDS